MFFRIRGHADAEMGGERVLQFIDVLAAVQLGDLLDQLAGVVVAVLFRDVARLSRRRVTAQGQDVLDAEKMQVDQRIFGFVAIEAAADQVGNRLYLEAVANGAADADGSGFLAPWPPGDDSVLFLIDHVRLVIGDVDELGIERHHGFDGGKDVVHALAAVGRRDFQRKHQFVVLLQPVDHFGHGIP